MRYRDEFKYQYGYINIINRVWNDREQIEKDRNRDRAHYFNQRRKFLPQKSGPIFGIFLKCLTSKDRKS